MFQKTRTQIITSKEPSFFSFGLYAWPQQAPPPPSRQNRSRFTTLRPGIDIPVSILLTLSIERKITSKEKVFFCSVERFNPNYMGHSRPHRVESTHVQWPSGLVLVYRWLIWLLCRSSTQHVLMYQE